MIVICHGMVKSASSFATQIVLQLCAAYCYHKKIELLDLKTLGLVTGDTSNSLYLDESDCNKEFFEKALKKLHNNMLVVKSHADFPEEAKLFFINNEIKVIYTYRNPAEICLSLIDAGQLDKERGLSRFTHYSSLESTYKAVDWQIECFANWATKVPIFTLFYDDFVSRPVTTSQEIANFLGIDWCPLSIRDLICNKESNVWEFNKGKLYRAGFEMNPTTHAALKNRWKDFYHFIEKRDTSYLKNLSTIIS